MEPNKVARNQIGVARNQIGHRVAARSVLQPSLTMFGCFARQPANPRENCDASLRGRLGTRPSIWLDRNCDETGWLSDIKLKGSTHLNLERLKSGSTGETALNRRTGWQVPL